MIRCFFISLFVHAALVAMLVVMDLLPPRFEPLDVGTSVEFEILGASPAVEAAPAAPATPPRPKPTATPAPPEETPLVIETPEPTPVKTPDPTPDPTIEATPEPTITPLAILTPEPTATATPEPTATPTPEPTKTPRPTPTATPKAPKKPPKETKKEVVPDKPKDIVEDPEKTPKSDPQDIAKNATPPKDPDDTKNPPAAVDTNLLAPSNPNNTPATGPAVAIPGLSAGGTLSQDLGRTYLLAALRQVKENFKPPIKSSTMFCRIKFIIQKNGQITNITIVQSTGTDAYDQYAVNALERTRQLPPLYDGLRKNLIEAEFTFKYDDTP